VIIEIWFSSSRLLFATMKRLWLTF
jgi:hypothetical protein